MTDADPREGPSAAASGAAAGTARLLIEPEPRSHIVQFYEDEEALATAMAAFLLEGADRREGLLVVAASSRWPAYHAALTELGVDVARLEAAERLVVLDAEETLGRIMRDGLVHRESFERAIGGAAARLMARGVRSIRAFGEMVDILWQDGDLAAALDLERHWNTLLRSHPVTLLCGYRLSLLGIERANDAFQHVCELHSHAIVVEDRARLDRAVDLAFDEVVGPERADTLRPLVRANRWTNEHLGEAERTIFWVRRNLPGTSDRLLARARHHL